MEIEEDRDVGETVRCFKLDKKGEELTIEQSLVQKSSSPTYVPEEEGEKSGKMNMEKWKSKSMKKVKVEQGDITYERKNFLRPNCL